MTKKCLVICPFGPEGSEERKRSDEIFNYLIKPVAEEKGYETKRLIDEANPGFISGELMQRLYQADIVIADITGSNPNVFYELALRHSMARPFIHISEDTDNIPFDVAQAQVTKITISLEGVDKTKKNLSQQIEQIENKGADFSNPASMYRPKTDSLVKAFYWTLRYSPTLAQDWLNLKDPSFQTLVKDYLNDALDKPLNPMQKPDLAEYFAYKNAQGIKLRGELYYILDQETDTFMGWGVLKFANSATNLAIPIDGRQKEIDQLIVEFDQPPQRVTIPPDFDEEIRGFNYKVEFLPNFSQKKTLDGTLFHPEYIDNGHTKLCIAETSLTFRN
jgi:hypothetical protein